MINVEKDSWVILNKCIYGLVQAAHQYYKKAMETLKSFGFVGGSIGPFLCVKKSAKGIVHKDLYVDDNIMVGDIATINNTIEALKSEGLVWLLILQD